MSDTERIERLETIVRSLNQQLAELRAEVSALNVAPRPRPAPPSPASRPALSAPPAWRSARASVQALDLEGLIGRYGTIALSTLALLAGMGAFLTWAIAHGLLGPSQRVVLGAIGAAAVAGIGWWLRSRGTARFGDTLLALALALLHLDLWAAGPRLHVIPPALALVITAVASVALASLALRTAEEPLFCVGLGGAFAAPFVASAGSGSAGMLAGYGWIVISGALAAMSTRAWRFAIALIGAGCAVYAAASQQLLSGDAGWAERAIPTLFALACAWAALAWGMRAVRARLALGFLVVAAAVLVAFHSGSQAVPTAIVLGLAGTVTALLAPRLGSIAAPWEPAAVVLLPLAFLGGALLRLAHPDTTSGAAVALLWLATACAAAWSDEERRDLHLTAACSISAVAVFLALNHQPEWCVVALAAHASIFSELLRRRRAPAIAVPVAIVLTLCCAWSYSLLVERTAYVYHPFMTAPSAAAFAAVLGLWVFSRSAMHLSAVDVSILAALPTLAVFFWFHQELALAYSPDISVFLLIIFYALAGIAAIAHGRRHSRATARTAGLALACYAAMKALVHAWGLSAIGLRVGACILAGAFIALVAYWYRGEGEGERKQKADSREQGSTTSFRGQGAGGS